MQKNTQPSFWSSDPNTVTISNKIIPSVGTSTAKSVGQPNVNNNSVASGSSKYNFNNCTIGSVSNTVSSDPKYSFNNSTILKTNQTSPNVVVMNVTVTKSPAP